MSMPVRAYVTDRTSDAFARAHILAERLGHQDVTPVHVTLGIIDEGRNVGAILLLYSCRVHRDSVVRDLESQLPAPASPLTGQRLAWSFGDEQMLLLAAAEARELGHVHLGCEHLLLAFLRDPSTGPGAVLAQHGVEFGRVREDLASILDGTMIWHVDESDTGGPAA